MMNSYQCLDSSRRTFLLLAAAASVGSLAGCCLFPRRSLTPICPQSPDVSLPNGPLTIDAHCHVFNGTDLQIKEFFSKVASKQSGALGIGARVLGGVLQDLAWTFAPDGKQELSELRNVVQQIKTCSDNSFAKTVSVMRQNAYGRGRKQLQAAAAKDSEFSALREKLKSGVINFELDEDTKLKIDAIQLIDSLPSDVESYHLAKTQRRQMLLSSAGPSVQGLIDFVLQNFQYRYVSVYDYLRTYNQKDVRVVDLMLPSMVDYDWWLSKGGPTTTSLRDQVEVMREISILTGGRVHTFVPFDPLRQVAFDLGFASEDSYSLVTDAITKYGFVGVKLYPPMGFAALGNAGLKKDDGTNFWNREWLPSWTNRSDLGDKLDGAMRKLFSWCQEMQVPVMAHTSLSNGVSKDFEALAGVQYWDNALNAFPNLRISFGHFGDSTPVKDRLEHALGFASLMNNGVAPGNLAYADAGYFVEILGSEPALKDKLRQLFDSTAGKGDAALANRFMYGTDWEMTLTEGSVSAYLGDFVKLFTELEDRPAMRSHGLTNLPSKFFGLNAVKWIGLHKGEATRNRLDAFYAENGVVITPDWAKKVDQ